MNYDILHYCGHCFFDAKNPESSGWIFEDGVLSAQELTRLDRVPRFIFSNACESGITPERAEASSPGWPLPSPRPFFDKECRTSSAPAGRSTTPPRASSRSRFTRDCSAWKPTPSPWTSQSRFLRPRLISGRTWCGPVTAALGCTRRCGNRALEAVRSCHGTRQLGRLSTLRQPVLPAHVSGGAVERELGANWASCSPLIPVPSPRRWTMGNSLYRGAAGEGSIVERGIHHGRGGNRGKSALITPRQISRNFCLSSACGVRILGFITGYISWSGWLL